MRLHLASSTPRDCYSVTTLHKFSIRLYSEAKLRTSELFPPKSCKVFYQIFFFFFFLHKNANEWVVFRIVRPCLWDLRLFHRIVADEIKGLETALNNWFRAVYWKRIDSPTTAVNVILYQTCKIQGPSAAVCPPLFHKSSFKPCFVPESTMRHRCFALAAILQSPLVK